MRAHTLGAFIGLFALSCSGSPPVASRPPTAATVKPAAEMPVASENHTPPRPHAAAPTFLPLPPALDRPGDIVCSYRSASFAGRRPGTTLALRDGGKPFAKLWGTVEADVHVRSGPA